MSEQGRNGRVRGLQVFMAGEHRGRQWTPAALDAMIRNFRRHQAPLDEQGRPRQPAMRVPLAVGHEEDDLERTDLPAHGVLERLYRKGPDLFADFGDVSPQAARDVRTKRLLSISPEIYDSPEGAGLDGTGHMLRRVCLLGAEPPQVKGMKPPDAAEWYAEKGGPGFRVTGFRRNEARASWTCFAEVRPMAPETAAPPENEAGTGMSREELVQRLGELGVETVALEGVPEPALAEWLRTLEAAQETPDDLEEPPAETPPKEEMPPAEEHMEYGEDAEPEMPADRDDHHAMADYYEMMGSRCRKMADGGGGPDAEVTNMTGAASPKKVEHKTTEHYSESDRRTVALIRRVIREEGGGVLKRLEKYSESREAADKKAAVESFLRLHSFAEGDPAGKVVRIYPWELDDAEPSNLRNQLLKADATTVVEKFSEGKKTVELTAFDLLKRSIEKRRPIRFGERLKAGKPSTSGATEAADADEAQIRDHFESFSERYQKHGMTADRLVAGFRAEKKRRHDLTAGEYLRA